MTEQAVSLRPHQRQEAIYRWALERGSVDVTELADRFQVTTETIRRDLNEMQHRRLLRRVHGGAVPVGSIAHEPMVEARTMLNAGAKLRIATAAAQMVPERGSVIIDSGSTGQRLAEVFPVERDVHVVTNSLMTAVTLSRRGLRDLTMLGGQVTTNTFATVDMTALEMIQNMAADVLFISCDGLSGSRGLSTPYREEQRIKSQMVAQSARVVAMVDKSKFGVDRMFSFASFDDVDVLVTDAPEDDETLAAAREAGTQVVRA